MAVLRTIITVIFIIDCIALVALVLMQEGKTAGLGAISGAAESYWGKNKGRSMEETLVKLTKICAIIFILLSAVLNIKF
ncbi:MAG: preprotein translocase subunit SecG [Lachnospiraceae bacterium]|nr:preprotein translocase subunit SecG [Lachnospiraceae bacterium]